MIQFVDLREIAEKTANNMSMDSALTLQELAEQSGRSYGTVSVMSAAGVIPTLSRGRLKFVHKDLVEVLQVKKGA